MSFDNIFEYAKSVGCEAEREVQMSKYTTFRIGGNAAVMLTPQTDEQLVLVIKECKKENNEMYSVVRQIKRCSIRQIILN